MQVVAASSHVHNILAMQHVLRHNGIVSNRHRLLLPQSILIVLELYGRSNASFCVLHLLALSALLPVVGVGAVIGWVILFSKYKGLPLMLVL